MTGRLFVGHGVLINVLLRNAVYSSAFCVVRRVVDA